MTSSESQRAAMEARRAVVDSTASASRHDAALQRYLAALEHSERVNELAHRDQSHGDLPVQSAPARVVVAAEAAASVDGLLAPIGSGETAPEHHSQHEKVSSRSDLVVVGIDTSSSSYTAFGWAAEEAARRHAVLRLVHAFTLPSRGFPGFNPMSHDAQ
ncbi:MAG TPA: universal stress protein, partial [Nakamurella sp.]|nr:universal stress protein [Nakamurella sp.]